MSSCHEMRARIHARGDHGLAIEALLELEEHLESCPRCRALSVRVRTVDEALSVLPGPSLTQIDLERSVRAVHAAIDERTRTTTTSRKTGEAPRRIRRIALALPLAAAAALIVWIAWPHAPAVPAPVEPRGDGVVQSVPAPVSMPEPVIAPEAPAVEIAEPPLPAPPSESDGDPIDPARLAKAREDVRLALHSASTLLVDPGSASSAQDFAESFDDSVRELTRSGWPVARLVEPLANDLDPLLAGAALRWLGARGERISSRTLKSAFSRPELKLAACQALLDSGERGLDGLAPTLRDGALRPRVLAALLERHAASSVSFLERALRARTLEEPSAALSETLDALAGSGVEGIAAMLRLASTHAVNEESMLAAFERNADAGAGLAELVAVLPRGIDAGLVLRAARRVRSQECIGWLAERCTDPRTERSMRSEALDTIAAVGGTDALVALLAVHKQERMDPADVDAALAHALARSGPAARELVNRYTQQAHDLELRTLFEASTLETDAGLVPTWLALAASDRLANTDRRTLFLLIGEHGSLSDAACLAGIYALLHASDKDLRAAALFALHALGEPEALRTALASLTPRVSATVRALFDSADVHDKPTALLLRLARALDGATSPRL